MKIASLPVLWAIAALSHANDGRYYVGIDAFFGNGEETTEIGREESSDEADHRGRAFTLGYRYPDNDRFEIELTKITSEFDDGRKEEFEGIDFSWSLGILPQPSMQPYVEVGFGLYEYQESDVLTEDNEDLTGLALHVGLGAIYEISPRLELDASYRVKHIGWEGTSEDEDDDDNIMMSEEIAKLVFGLRFIF